MTLYYTKFNFFLEQMYITVCNKRIEYKLLSLSSLAYKVLITAQLSHLHNLISLQPPRSTRSSSVVTLSRPANHLLLENHRSLIQICITSSLESTSRFISSASPVLSRFTSSFTCQAIFVIITTLSIHHTLTLWLQAQNLPFQQILSTKVDFWYPLDCLH